MSSHYTIVQYVPDPTAEERVNFGVIVWDKERIRSQFLVDWRRVRAFGREDIGFLRDFAKSATEMTSDQPNLPELGQEFDHKHLKKLIGDWSYSIQFTEPRGSIKSAANLLEDVADAFLREPAQPAVRWRTGPAPHAARLIGPTTGYREAAKSG